MTRRLVDRLFEPVDGASLAAFRFLVCAVGFVSLTRFMLQGWIERLYVRPSFFFKYPGFEWVPVFGPTGLYLLFGAVAVLAACVGLGLFYRVTAPLLFFGFLFVQLMDVTNYLNHYYLYVLFLGMLAVLPLHRVGSLDARRRPDLAVDRLPRWMVWLVRFQLCAVYLFAGVAKMGEDWLRHAQPLNLWLRANTELPVVGPWLDELWVAYAMSWAGCLYDSTIWIFLLWSRTRPFAYVAVVVFHLCTQALFEIGMFPAIMIVSTTIFFAPDWPRRLLRRPDRGRRPPPASPTTRRWIVGALVAYVAVQVVLPLRHFAAPGDVLWNEVGMRYAWKVMVREKTGSLTYRVHLPSGRVVSVSPHDYLEWRQVNEMSGQPDLVVQLAKHIAADFAARGYGEVEVHADALVSLNGRPPQRFLDPDVDLNRVDAHDFDPAWVLPAPIIPPIQLRPSG